jgi:GNAT superfamily N-acetyltransferase
MQPDAERVVYRIAEESDFDSIHRLNYRTFVEEIPQHPPNAECRLVDRFHADNTYVIATLGDQLVGMVCGRCARPFSLDQKVENLDRWLPAHEKAVEIRLLAVMPAYRKTTVLRRLLAFLARHFATQGCDLAVISGTVRELRLYGHLGFQAFGQCVGTPEAAYQPMYLSLASVEGARYPLHVRSSA